MNIPVCNCCGVIVEPSFSWCPFCGHRLGALPSELLYGSVVAVLAVATITYAAF